jgi:hypothetical protein
LIFDNATTLKNSYLLGVDDSWAGKMNPEERRAEYLNRAKDAEEQAAKAKDDSFKASWLRIAASYYNLAMHESLSS